MARKAAKNKHRAATRTLGDPGFTGVLQCPTNPGEDFLTGTEWVAIASAARLTTREMVVATLLLKGRTRKGIAYRLKLSPETVRVHIDRLFAKLHVKDRLGFGLRIARFREAIQATPWRLGAAESG